MMHFKLNLVIKAQKEEINLSALTSLMKKAVKDFN